MRKFATCGLLTASLCSPLFAQTPKYVYALPDGFLNSPGQVSGGVAYVFDRPDFAYQEVHTTWTGQKTKVLTGMAFRRSWGQAENLSNTARTADVTITLGTGSHASFNKTSFAGNFLNNSATIVHPKTKVAMPDWTKAPLTIPAAFDARFPFKTPFVYDGKADFVWHIRYENCSEQNRTRYYCDRANSRNYVYSSGHPIGVGCTATGRTSAHSLTSRFYNYGPNGATYKMRLYLDTANNPSSAPVVVALGAKQLNVPVPGWCANLVPDPLLFLPAGTATSTGSLSTKYYDFGYTPAAEGASVFLQAYCPDAGLNAGISLTEGERLTMPPAVTTSVGGTFKYLYKSSPTSTSLSGPYTAGSVVTGWH